MSQALGERLASVGNQRMRRYRELLSSSHSLSDAEVIELDGLLKALGKTAAAFQQDSDTLLSAMALQADLANTRELSDAARKTTLALIGARERHRKMVDEANEFLRQHVVADNAARAAVVELGARSRQLSEIKKRSPELFAD
jgi:hypothetical protein